MKDTASRSSQAGVQNKEMGHSSNLKPDSRKGLYHLFIVELKDIYWAEKVLTKTIAKLIKNATAPELIDMLTVHLEVTKKHIIRLQKVFYSVREEAIALKYEAMYVLIKQAELLLTETEKGKVLDSEIISAFRKIELYKITTYRILCYFAQTLGEDNATKLLQGILNEESNADEKLSEIAKSLLNAAEAAGTD